MDLISTSSTSFNSNFIAGDEKIALTVKKQKNSFLSLSLLPDPLIKEIASYIKPADRLMMSTKDFDNLAAVNHLFLRLLKEGFFENMAFTNGVTENVENSWSKTALKALGIFQRMISHPLTSSHTTTVSEEGNWSRTFLKDGSLALIPPLYNTKTRTQIQIPRVCIGEYRYGSYHFPHSLIELRDGRLAVSFFRNYFMVVSRDSNQKEYVLETGTDDLRNLCGFFLELNHNLLLCRFKDSFICVWSLVYPLEQTTIYPQMILKPKDTLSFIHSKEQMAVSELSNNHWIQLSNGLIASPTQGYSIEANPTQDYSIKIWNLTSKVILKSLYGHQHPITFLREVQGYLASAAYDNTIKIWSIYQEKCIRTLKVSQGCGDAILPLISCGLYFLSGFSGEYPVLKIWHPDGTLIGKTVFKESDDGFIDTMNYNHGQLKWIWVNSKIKKLQVKVVDLRPLHGRLWRTVYLGQLPLSLISKISKYLNPSQGAFLACLNKQFKINLTKKRDHS